MANAIPMLIRCPKCLTVLSEIPGVAVYKCGGCAAILRAKVVSSSGKTSSSASAASSSKDMSDSGSLENEVTDFGKKNLSASNHSGSRDQVLKAKVSGVGGRRKFSENGANFGESEFDGGNFKERRSQASEQNGVNLTEHNLNGKGMKSFQHAISAQHDDEDDKMFQKIRNVSSFLLRSRSFQANLPRKVMSRFDFPARERGISSPSEDFRSALNIVGSENGAASESRSKDPKQSAKFGHPEKIVQAKILRKVDELRIDLRRYFDRGASRLSASARFDGKFPPIQYPSLFIPPSEEPPPEDIFLRNEHRGRSPHNVHPHPPVSGGAASTHPLHRDPHSAKISTKTSHELKCYCRPVSGGAPFVICAQCHDLLRLPADFLLVAKRVHKLRCGTCSGVLSYTFRPKDRPAAWTRSEVRLPPAEDGKSLGEVLDDEIATALRLTYIKEGDAVSKSDGYNPSLGKSSSRGSIVEEEDHGGKGSRRLQLHKLMGYSSARFLLFNAFSASEGSRTEQDR
ncbi:hypothetical protein KSP40_PGU021351 [Platanthera guangdongensis]|uniref:Zinc-ribbon domain-containing protein n=1 Tax=Platanthera guangdongensis TaxID=2320717 RepID=A0ABR2MIB7_9ASPA